jgi:phage gpG-like protein
MAQAQGTHLKVEVVGLEENRKMLDDLRRLDLSQWFGGDAAKVVRSRLGDIMKMGVDRPKWPAHHPFTLENKKTSTMMIESGALFRSITEKTGNSIFEVTSRSMEIGSNLVYAAIHNFGGKIPVTPKMRSFLHWKGLHLKKTTNAITIPQREYLFVSKPMETALYTSLAGYIQRIINEYDRK